MATKTVFFEYKILSFDNDGFPYDQKKNISFRISSKYCEVAVNVYLAHQYENIRNMII